MSKIIQNGHNFGRTYINGDTPKKLIINGDIFKLAKDPSLEPIILCHFEDDFVNNQFTDAKGNIFTRNNNRVNISDTYKKFGNKSAIWSSSASAFAKTDLMPELNFLTNDFTIDFWVYLYGTGTRRTAFSLGLQTARGIQIELQNNTPVMWFMHPTANKWLIGGDTYDYSGISSINIPSNTWNHLAMVRNGNIVTLYINGRVGVSANIGSASMRDFGVDGAVCQVGTWGINTANYPFRSGAIDELRIVGRAVWTDEFTPPTEPY